MSNSRKSFFDEKVLNAVDQHAKEGGPLTTSKVAELAVIHGPNTIVTEKKHPSYLIFLQALFHPFNILLSIIAISSAVAALQDPEPDYSTTIIISGMIIISTCLRFYQECRSEGAVSGLLKLITKTVSVVRIDAVENTARELKIPSDELVPGDWIVIRPGEVVPADGIILTSKVFFVSQAPLTGEAIPVEKYNLNEQRSALILSNGTSVTGTTANKNDHVGNFVNEDVEKPKPAHKPISKVRRFLMVMLGIRVSTEAQLDENGYLLTEDLSSPDNVFMGTQVITGMANIRVVRTGQNTLLGRMASALSKAQPINDFQRGVKRISWMFFLFMGLMVPPIFMIRGFGSTDEDRWMTAFLFSLSVAVGLTPEMLPMIVNANLAKGSVELTKKNSIVKKLDAIINLGAVDVLCTDKTGTLTTSVTRLSSHIGPQGEVSDIPIRIAFLNAYFQSVVQNPLDSAIVSFYIKMSASSTGTSEGLAESGNDNKEPEIKPRRRRSSDVGALMFVKNFSRLDELPFDFVRRRLSVVLKDNKGNVYLACKGAVEEILSVCTKSLKEVDQSEVFPSEPNAITIDAKQREHIMTQYATYSDRGEKVLGVAYKLMPSTATKAALNDEVDMIFTGFISFVDPPKDSAKLAIEQLQKHNVEVKVLTGDALNICAQTCNSINLPVKSMLTGTDVQLAFEKGTLSQVVEEGTIFAKLTPLQKALVVQALCDNGHVVAFMGDGINDAPALKEADIGFSVDNAVDICRESANVILLDKDLNVVVEGIRIGRKTYGNTIKYIVMAVSSNFGNVFSVLVAASWLPYEPMTSLQILTQNLLYDISQIAIPWDSVDEEFLYVPHKWRMKSILRFTIVMGPWSSVFDITTFLYMYFHHNIKSKDNPEDVRLFQTAWFTVGLLTQTLIVHIIRSPKLPFIRSRASWPVCMLTLIIMGAGLAMPYIPEVHDKLELIHPVPKDVYGFVAIVLASYCIVATLVKLIYVRIFKEWF